MAKSKKCLIGVAVSDSNQFKDNSSLVYVVKMKENDLIVPVAEIDGETVEELREKVKALIDELFDVF
jgi:hypothetical protein